MAGGDIQQRAGTGASAPYLGRPLPRLEDAALLTGRARFSDDLPVAAGTLHAAILRSPHAHAEIEGLDAAKALALPGVAAVVTGADAKRWTAPFIVGVKAPLEQWCLAAERVRYVGEPVAVVLAEDRYLAEDALDLIEVRYKPLPAVTSIAAAEAEGAPLLHEKAGSNTVSNRLFRYGDPEAAFEAAPHRVTLEALFPRNACTPIECFVVQAEYHAAEDAYDVRANFSGPFALHPVMARSLAVPSNRLRLRMPPHSGGSFGNKQAVFPYIVLMGLAARVAGRPVKWTEDRLEHLMAATSATGRRLRLEAAVESNGKVRALKLEQTEDCGAYVRAPEPASLYRNHGNLTGAYAIEHLAVENRIVVSNRTPTGLNRGFGGGQLYFGLEQLMRRIALELDLDPLEVIRRNLVPAEAMPHRTASGGLLDGGDYAGALDEAVEKGGLKDLLARRDAARAEGRLYGIGYACLVEPSISNMGYITTVLKPEERAKAGPKNGAQASATVTLDPLGGVAVTVASVPQGQGHRTVLAQVVADRLGVKLESVTVNTELDTQKDAWSIASGNYASRFAGAVAGAADLAARRLRDRLAGVAAPLLNVKPESLQFAGGKVFAEGNPDNALSFTRLAAGGHWSPGELPAGTEAPLRETAFWTPPELEAPDAEDHINSSACYGFLFDFCGVEVDRETGRVAIDRYVTMHDAGRLLNPLLVDGQIQGAFAHGLGAALLEEHVYSEDGSFLSGTFVDYLVPTACEVPRPVILHRDSVSSVTPLGAKGVGEGNCMSTPVCLANAVADALGLPQVDLPLLPSKVAALIQGEEPAAPARAAAPRVAAKPARGGERGLTGSGEQWVASPRQELWNLLLDPKELARLLPGCEALEEVGENSYRAEITLRVGPIRTTYKVAVALRDLQEPESLTLAGEGSSPLGGGAGEGAVTLTEENGGTRVAYSYSAAVTGKVAAVGGRMLDGAARMLLRQFFDRLAARVGGEDSASTEARGWWARLLSLLGIGR